MKAPIVKAEMLIRKPAADVFNAFVDPAITTKFWFTKSSDKLEAGKRVHWDWEMYGVGDDIDVKTIEPNTRIVFEWSFPKSNLVEMTFTPHARGTLLAITNSGLSGDNVIAEALDLTQGEHTKHFWSRYVQSDWRVGARVEFLRADRSRLSHDGEVLEIDAPHKLVMTFDVTAEGLAEPPSRVTYELSHAHGATKLIVTHDQFPPNSQVLKGVSEGWPHILSSMKSYLERGEAMSMTEAMRKARGE